MIENWASHEDWGGGDVFHVPHRGLTVELIMTKHSQFMTCAPHETLYAVLARNAENYDFLPVVAA